LKQGDALSLFIFNSSLDYSIRKIQKNKEGLELNGTHQLLVYADDVNLLDENINIIKENTEALSDASKEVRLEVNTEKSKYTFMPCHKTAGQNLYIKAANKSFENVSEFIYLGMTVTNKNCILGEIKSRLNLGNASYHALQNLCLPVCYQET
jgi:hypothetical protein